MILHPPSARNGFSVRSGFLVTRGVPCEKRIADLQKFHQENADELERDAEDGWVETINPEQNKPQAVLNLDDMGDGVQVIDGDDDGNDN